MTPSIPAPRLDLIGQLPLTPRPARTALHPAEARALRRAGLFHRLVQWWVRPLGDAGGTATDAATRLEILSRGGFPR